MIFKVAVLGVMTPSQLEWLNHNDWIWLVWLILVIVATIWHLRTK